MITTLQTVLHITYSEAPLEQTTCYPGSYSALTQQYYSPGLCPSGFIAACQSTNRAGTVEETVLTCCPTYVGTLPPPSIKRLDTRLPY
ncbi:hypothetical protein F4802DRAFT_574105, partial [Xylaria palmicola]